MNTPLKTSIGGIAALCLFLLANLGADRTPFANQAFLIDFQAFYCAGSVHAAGENPYRVEPLRRCEHREVAVPAPLPGYDLAFFSLFAKLPFQAAAVLWESTLAIAFCVTVFALTRLTRLEPLIVFASLLFSDAIASLFFGQLVPLAVAALSVGMLCISRKQFSAAALCAACSLVEPHVGLGACCALFFAPRCRIALLGAIGCLLLISAADHGFVNDLAYLHDILPAHAAAEIRNEDQYSLSHLLFLLGIPERIAIAAGALSYAVALAASLFAAERLCRRGKDEALLIALPPAFTLIGGPFTHIHQMAAALPAALFFLARFPAYRLPASIAIFLLAIPWSDIYLLIRLGPLLAMTTVVLSARLLRVSLLRQALISIATTISVFVANDLFTESFVRLPAIIPSGPKASAEETWRLFVNTHDVANQILFLLLKIPTWIALFLTAGIAFHAGNSTRRRNATHDADTA